MMIDNLGSRSISLQLRGILEAVTCNKLNSDEKSALEMLEKSHSVIAGRKISDYAIAAQSILGIKEYSGDDPYIIDLIRDMPKFRFDR